jgi:hypothetical protein
MEKILMTREEFKKFDKKIQEIIQKYDASAIIESELVPMTIVVSGAEQARAVWTVSGKAFWYVGETAKEAVYSFTLFLRDGYVWELESYQPSWTTSGNQKQLDRVLRDYFDNLYKAFHMFPNQDRSDIPTDFMNDGRLTSRIIEAVDRTVSTVIMSNS